ncbi:MAG: hypothetical protein UR23_C0051G0010 [Candidatus Roizmanbacteria bacterium GW2011_GWA2_32_13]|uniref:Uncharacterized protein n=1 Tax=Candidatus Roizmanbacteria bacterium GW2011_GWA2_32_13 TaxID=1618475 RepID=A0A0G0B2B0_9BACT|nr:MAG: hypothetical protein UR23_C0051G0010 [Candidatus Roizmanbacteria bacterium GW2011_GWA2_32_13]
MTGYTITTVRPYVENKGIFVSAHYGDKATFGGYTGTKECFVSVGDKADVSGISMVATGCIALCRFARLSIAEGGCQLVSKY